MTAPLLQANSRQVLTKGQDRGLGIIVRESQCFGDPTRQGDHTVIGSNNCDDGFVFDRSEYGFEGQIRLVEIDGNTTGYGRNQGVTTVRYDQQAISEVFCCLDVTGDAVAACRGDE